MVFFVKTWFVLFLRFMWIQKCLLVSYDLCMFSWRCNMWSLQREGRVLELVVYLRSKCVSFRLWSMWHTSIHLKSVVVLNEKFYHFGRERSTWHSFFALMNRSFCIQLAKIFSFMMAHNMLIVGYSILKNDLIVSNSYSLLGLKEWSCNDHGFFVYSFWIATRRVLSSVFWYRILILLHRLVVNIQLTTFLLCICLLISFNQ